MTPWLHYYASLTIVGHPREAGIAPKAGDALSGPVSRELLCCSSRRRRREWPYRSGIECGMAGFGGRPAVLQAPRLDSCEEIRGSFMSALIICRKFKKPRTDFAPRTRDQAVRVRDHRRRPLLKEQTFHRFEDIVWNRWFGSIIHKVQCGEECLRCPELGTCLCKNSPRLP